MSILALLACTTVLIIYLVIPWLVISGLGIQEISGERTLFCVFLFGVGNFLMIGSDC